MSDQRDTFKQIRQIVAESARHADGVAEKLVSLKTGDVDGRLGLLIDTWISNQRTLASNLGQYAEDMDKTIAEEYAQYKMDVNPNDVSDPPGSPTAASLTRWLLDENARVGSLFGELERSGASEQSREAIGALVQLMESHARRIARENEDSDDI